MEMKELRMENDEIKVQKVALEKGMENCKRIEREQHINDLTSKLKENKECGICREKDETISDLKERIFSFNSLTLEKSIVAETSNNDGHEERLLRVEYYIKDMEERLSKQISDIQEKVQNNRIASNHNKHELSKTLPVITNPYVEETTHTHKLETNRHISQNTEETDRKVQTVKYRNVNKRSINRETSFNNKIYTLDNIHPRFKRGDRQPNSHDGVITRMNSKQDKSCNNDSRVLDCNKTVLNEKIYRDLKVIGTGTEQKLAIKVKNLHWIYVGKFKRDFNESGMENLMRTEFGSNNKYVIEVIDKTLKFTGEEYRCFKIGVDEKLKEEIYKSYHWPQDIIVSPFRFFRYYSGNGNRNGQYSGRPYRR